MNAPSALTLNCQDCGQDTLHRVLRGRMGTRSGASLVATVECSECSKVTKVTIKEQRTRDVPIIISDQGVSERAKIELSEAEMIAVGESLMVDGLPTLIMSLESKGKRVDSAKVVDITTIWTKRYDKVKVKVSVNRGGKTYPRDIWAVPDEEFYVGDVLELKGRLRAAITSIKTQDRSIKRGGAVAGEIKRIYGKVVR